MRVSVWPFWGARFSVKAWLPPDVVASFQGSGVPLWPQVNYGSGYQRKVTSLKSGPQRGPCVPAGDRRWGQGCSDVAFAGVCRSGLQEQFEQQPDGIGVRNWISTSVSLYVCSDYLAPLLIPLCWLIRHQVEGCRVRTGVWTANTPESRV